MNQSTALSQQKIALLAKCLEFEATDLQTVTNFAKRIGKDAGQTRVQLGIRSTDNLDEYAAVIWQVVSSLNGLPLELVQRFAQDLKNTLEEVGV